MKISKTFLYIVSARLEDPGDVNRDMLRYDRAFVNPKYPGIVAMFNIKGDTGTYDGTPTYGRWDSFGFNLMAADVSSESLLYNVQHEIRPDEWTTYRRPRPDAELQPITLEQVLKFKNFSDLDASLK